MINMYKVFFFIISLNSLHADNSVAPAIMPKPDEVSTYSEAEFQKLMKDWNQKIKSIDAGKSAAGLFEVAEKIIKMNDDQFSNLAEDLSVLMKSTQKRTLLRKAWVPHQNNPSFINSEAENLFEMAERLADKGNG